MEPGLTYVGSHRLTYVGLLRMTEHRYSVGDLVRVQGGASIHSVEGFLDRPNHQRLTGVYEIIRLLPEMLNGQPQYQIKGFNGEGTYVVRESQLAALPQPRR